MRNKNNITFTNDELNKLVEDKTSCVSVHQSVYNLNLTPHHLDKISTSIKELLNRKVAKYDQRLNGILLGYKNLKLVTPQGTIVTDNPHIHIDIHGDFYIFKPENELSLTGVVNKTSKNHVGCLVHKVFNVSVPNKSEDENWLGLNVQIGDTVKLLVEKTQLDDRLPYIMASITEIISSNKTTSNISFDENDLNLIDSKDIKPPKKQKKKKSDKSLNESSENVENPLKKEKRKSKNNESIEKTKLEFSNDSPDFLAHKEKKSKKRNSKTNEDLKQQTQLNNNLLKSDLKDSMEEFVAKSNEKKKKKKRNSNTHESVNETKTSNDFDLESLTSKLITEQLDTLNITKSSKKEKKNRKSEEFKSTTNLEISSPTKAMTDSDHHKKKKPKTNETINETKITNDFDLESLKSKLMSEQLNTLNALKLTKKEKKLHKNEELISSLNLKFSSPTKTMTDSDDHKKKKYKTKDSINETKTSNDFDLESLTNKLITEQLDTLNTSKNKKKEKKLRKSDELISSTNLDISSSIKAMADSKKKHKTNESVIETKIINDFDLESSMKSKLIAEKLDTSNTSKNTKKEKKLRKSEELKSATNLEISSPTKTMADSNDHKKKKHKINESVIETKITNDLDLESLKSKLISEQLDTLNTSKHTKKEKKHRKSKELIGSTNLELSFSTKTMADSDDHKKKKHKTNELSNQINMSNDFDLKSMKSKLIVEKLDTLNESKHKKKEKKLHKSEELKKTTILEISPTKTMADSDDHKKKKHKTNESVIETKKTNDFDLESMKSRLMSEQLDTLNALKNSKRDKKLRKKEKLISNMNLKLSSTTKTTDSDDHKKKKHKTNKSINETKKSNDFKLESLKSKLISEELNTLNLSKSTKKEKKHRKNKELISSTNTKLSSPTKPIADSDDRKKKKHKTSNAINETKISNDFELESLKSKLISEQLDTLNLNTSSGTKKEKKHRKEEESISDTYLKLTSNIETMTVPEDRKKKKHKKTKSSESINKTKIINDGDLESLKSNLIIEELDTFNTLKSTKEEKKHRKSEKLISTTNLTLSSHINTMADSVDRKTKKRRLSVSRTNIDWENMELNLHDSDLEQTLASDEKKVACKDFNLAKISALNEGSFRKRNNSEGDVNYVFKQSKKCKKSKKSKE